MKLITRFLSLTVLAAAALLYSGCKDDGGETKSEEETELEALSKTWTLTAATLDGDSRLSDFTNVKLSLSGTFSPGGIYEYSFTGTMPQPSPIPKSGKWKFGSVGSQIIREPGAGNENFPMHYTLSGNTLTLTFDCEECEYAGGRVSTVNGQWELTFTN
jgi:hypothetical protein